MANSRDSEQAVEMPASAASTPRWYWPLRPLTWVAAGIVALLALFVNYQPITAAYVDLNRGSFDPEFSIGREFVHGWPLRYAHREINLAVGPSWHPWDDVRSFHASNLAIDLVLWILAIIAAAYATKGLATGHSRSAGIDGYVRSRARLVRVCTRRFAPRTRITRGISKAHRHFAANAHERSGDARLDIRFAKIAL
jgi:hypothetical protein